MRKLIWAALVALCPATALASGPVSGPRFAAIYHRAGMVCWSTGDALRVEYAGWRRGETGAWEVVDMAERTGRACAHFEWGEDLPIPRGPTQRRLFAAWHDAAEMWTGFANSAYDDATGRRHITPTADDLADARAIATRIDYYSRVLARGGR